MDKCIDHGCKGVAFGYARARMAGVCTTKHRKVYCENAGVTLEQIKGQVVRHKCDNPRCINPSHLELGTYKDNMDDMRKRGREVKLEGTEQPNSKLTQEKVDWVRANYKARDSEYGCRAMARHLGVAHHVVSRIVSGVGYR